MKKRFFSIALLLLAGCLGYPNKVEPVKGFDLEKYLGKWYEIARFDHSFERNLEQISAEYSVREDGGVRVKNRGFSIKHRFSQSLKRHRNITSTQPSTKI